ncbi:MAG: tocopherol cyclase family protein [Anaerolineae bacterium]
MAQKVERMGYLDLSLHPERYHGHGKKPPFFEGWYFKLVDPTENHRYALIPGVFLNADPTKSHAFIQVLDGLRGRSHYYQFPLATFQAASDRFEVSIADNFFSLHRIKVNLSGGAISVQGDLTFEGGTGWPVTLSSPGIMGWFGWIPIMECNHGVCSFDHVIHGVLTLDGVPISFESGRGYIEKDWGKSFPSAWVWMQTNHFEMPTVCLTASIATIPWVGRTFGGFIIGFWQAGKLYRFATYTGAKVEKLHVTDDFVTWIVRDRLHRLEMTASRAGGGLLHEPTRQEMHKRVEETLKASVEVCLTRLKDGYEVFSGTGRNAGLEVQGNLSRLLVE